MNGIDRKMLFGGKMEKIDANNYEDILRTTPWVIFDFSSPGCAPCKKVPPLMNEIINEAELEIKAYEIDVTEHPQIAQKYMVLGVPTIIVFNHGKEVQRFNSVPKKEKIFKILR
jgi:thioredoxin-like negative regulator of GroEL